MPTLAQLHPQVVHFAVALLLLGVLFRIISLTGKLKFTDHAAAALLILGTIAALVSVKSGDEAHGPVERIPGARPIVIEHEEAAELTHDVFIAVVLLELIALGMALSPKTAGKIRLGTHAASALVGVWGGWTLYKTAELGGEIVYKYAGGPGIRSGAPEDVERLLLAGLYAQSLADRKAGNKVEAARLIDEMALRFSADTNVRFLRVESLLRDREDPAAAMAALEAITMMSSDARNGARRANLRADIFLATGLPDSAKATLDAAIAAFPQNVRLKARRDSLP
jgi:uncharacterized membrane protein